MNETLRKQLNDKNSKLRTDVLYRNHRETECGPVMVGDAVFAKGIGTFYGWIDVVLVCTQVMDNVARFSGYTDDGNLIGQYRWDAQQLATHFADRTLTLIETEA